MQPSTNTSKVLIDVSQVAATFECLEKTLLTPSEMHSIIRDNTNRWTYLHNLSSDQIKELIRFGNVRTLTSSTLNSLLTFLVKQKTVRKITLPFPHRTEHRFALGQVSNFAIVQSLDNEGYFSHFTALHLNGLTDQDPKTIYFNVEQHATGGGGELTQEALDRAFKLRPRVTSNVVKLNRIQIYKLNGRNTQRLGVVVIEHGQCELPLRVTDVERTLIDATVRPIYSGGVAVVARAFEMARDRASVDKIATYLQKLNYVYPYHQAIGFYLERAGYRKPELEPLRQFPMEFDFYLAHGIGSTEHNKTWRVFIPRQFLSCRLAPNSKLYPNRHGQRHPSPWLRDHPRAADPGPLRHHGDSRPLGSRVGALAFWLLMLLISAVVRSIFK